ncbi:glycerol acyltransferase [Chryseobacterium sp. Leaf404]|uniref:phage tail protein n=1 Tax=unclassified Chryseobacterium TaxID=2593645 RepID=UPI0006F9E3D0|nr:MULTISPECIES: phage tail protein [unclassified Chryseobacterium]KQT17916.1 glycerol acyltransferase [Chryseobacterium sp. Leaf404]
MPDNSFILGFHFSVVFELVPHFLADTRFQSVSGLKVTMDTESVIEGGQNRFKHSLPTRSGYQDLILKRGLGTDISGISMWCAQALEDFVFSPANLTVSLLNEKGNPVKVWYVSHAIPLSYEIADFNAEESKIVIETMTLRYNFFKEIPILGL